MNVFAKHHEVHTCPFCGKCLQKHEEFWPLYAEEWPYVHAAQQGFNMPAWEVKPGYDGVYHKECWKPWLVQHRLTR